MTRVALVTGARGGIGANRAAVDAAPAAHGRICVSASAHAVVASPFKAGYVSAKHGVLGPTGRGITGVPVPIDRGRTAA